MATNKWLPGKPANIQEYDRQRARVTLIRANGGDPETERAWNIVKSGVRELIFLAIIAPSNPNELKLMENFLSEGLTIFSEYFESIGLKKEPECISTYLSENPEAMALFEITALTIAFEMEHFDFIWSRLE